MTRFLENSSVHISIYVITYYIIGNKIYSIYGGDTLFKHIHINRGPHDWLIFLIFLYSHMIVIPKLYQGKDQYCANHTNV